MSLVKATIMVAMVVLVEVVLPMSIVDISILIVGLCRLKKRVFVCSVEIVQIGKLAVLIIPEN